MKLAFFGTPQFAETALKELIESKKYKPSLVITAPDKPVGRKKELTPPPVKTLAEKHKIKVLQPEKLDEKFIEKLSSDKWDVFIVAAYGKILPKKLLNIPKKETLNIHASLLPRWRGPSPIQTALLHGDNTTGNTIMLVDEQMDHGPIVAQSKVEIKNTDTAETLSKKLAKDGAKLLAQTLPKWLDDQIAPEEQDHSAATYSQIITRTDGHINWSNNVEFIERQSRAYAPWPGVYAEWNSKRLKLFGIKTIKQEINPEEYAKVVAHNNTFAIQAKNGLVIPKDLQLAGKKKQTVEEFLRGHPEIVESYLA